MNRRSCQLCGCTAPHHTQPPPRPLRFLISCATLFTCAGSSSEQLAKQPLTQLLESVDPAQEQQWRQQAQAQQRWEERQVPGLVAGPEFGTTTQQLLKLVFRWGLLAGWPDQLFVGCPGCSVGSGCCVTSTAYVLNVVLRLSIALHACVAQSGTTVCFVPVKLCSARQSPCPLAAPCGLSVLAQ
jgi:hypothetical protein